MRETGACCFVLIIPSPWSIYSVKARRNEFSPKKINRDGHSSVTEGWWRKLIPNNF